MGPARTAQGEGRRAPGRHRRPVRRHRFEIDPTPAPIRDALAAAADSPGYRADLRHLRSAKSAAGPAAPPAPRRGGRPGRDPAGHRRQGTRRGAARAARGVGPRRQGGRTRRSRSRRTTSARGFGRAEPVPVADGEEAGPGRCPAGLEINSPGSPHGAVRTADELRDMVAWTRLDRRDPGVRRALPSNWAGTTEPVSQLHADVCGGGHDGLLALHSLSKRFQPGRPPRRVRHRRPGGGAGVARRCASARR
ncbi:hypothetical protein ACU686_32420 [Yinghuangia aomiensis]